MDGEAHTSPAHCESLPSTSPPEGFNQDTYEHDWTPQTARADLPPIGEAVKLETRGVTSHLQQRKFQFDGEVIKETIVKKLLDRSEPELAAPLIKCHTTIWRKQCTSCKTVQTYWNRCEVFYCPVCAPRLSQDRRKAVEWWTKLISQPKHVVLTVRNVDTISREYVQWFKDCWSKMRRSKLAQHWKGGCYSLEITNEGKGWHLHLHALIDCRWIDAKSLAQTWANLVGQDFSIVKVKDCRQGDYLKEITKYVCDGQELARWSDYEIVAFITALKGLRTFGVFGSLFGQRAEFKRYCEGIQADKFECPCGCTTFKFYDSNEWEWYEATSGSIPPPAGEPRKLTQHPELNLNLPTARQFGPR